MIWSYYTEMAATRCMGCLVLRHVPVFRSHGRLAISRGIHQANVVYPFMLGKFYCFTQRYYLLQIFIHALSKFSVLAFFSSSFVLIFFFFFHPTFTCRTSHTGGNYCVVCTFSVSIQYSQQICAH